MAFFFITYSLLLFGLFTFLWETEKYNFVYFKNFLINSFDFKGKTKRKDFWSTYAWILLISPFLVISGITLFKDLGGASANRNIILFAITPILLEIIFLLIPNLSLQIRRLRDTGRNPLWIFLNSIPYGIGAIVLLIFYLSPSKERKTKATLQDKLKEVEDLLSKGTIDEEEYKYMRKQILGKHID